MPIVFFKKDYDDVQFPHNDVVIITLNMENYDIHRILVNNGSSTDVLYYDALLKIGISPEQLVRMSFLLVGFMEDTIQADRMITLIVRMGHYPL